MTQLPLPLALAELPAVPPTPPTPRPARSYTVTYDVVTPESAEEGEASESGFEGQGDLTTALAPYPHGSAEWHTAFNAIRAAATHPVEPDDGDIEDVLDSWTDARDTVTRATLACPDWTPLVGSPSREACESAAAVGIMIEVLRDRGCTEDGVGGTSWYSADGEVDIHTGETTTYAVHLDGFTPDEITAVRSAVRAPRGGR